MEEDDEIDVLGEFNLESLLTKNEDQISSCFDGDHQLGLHCESQWMEDTTSQACWYDNKADPQQPFGGLSALETYENNTWSDKERYLLEKGLELFGRSWSRLAQYIGTKNANQVKSYVKTMGIGWAAKSSGSTSSFGIDNMELNFSELIDDMDIPASMEEVIAVVSTAQPTVVLPTSQRDSMIVPSSPSNRKLKGRWKKNPLLGTKRRLVTEKPQEITHIYNAENIKDVLTGNMERDHIVLPNGEQVIRIRHGSSLSEDSDVEIDVDSDFDRVEDEFPLEEKDALIEEVINAGESFQCKTETELDEPQTQNSAIEECFVDDIGNEVSVLTENIVEPEKKNRETQVFKGSLVTPSGKVMTIVVDNMPCNSVDTGTKPTEITVSKYLSTMQERLDAVYQLPPPSQENIIDRYTVTQEEKFLHTEFFSKSNRGLKRYLKIRNYIIDSWINSKPNYVTKTSVRVGLKSCGDVNLISRIHAYLEKKGYINFGCVQFQNNNKSCTQANQNSPTLNGSGESVDVEVNSSERPKANVSVERRESGRERKKKLPFDGISKRDKSISTRKVQESSNEKSIQVQDKSIYKWRSRKKKPAMKYESGNEKSTQVQDKSIYKWSSRKKKPAIPYGEGGYTMVHTDSGEIVIQFEASSKKQKVDDQTSAKKMNTRQIKPVKLIHCKDHTVGNKAPYKLELDVSALVLVDVHSHLSPRCEVIGLLGGQYQQQEGVLSITAAVPCRTIVSSNIHCDMCPVSQLESSEIITDRGLSVVGWYHSHPEFDPSPSDTDINTQNMLQSWFNETGKPFVGLIISPYYSVHNVSSYRCCHVIMEKNGLVPYKLEAKLTNVDESIDLLREYILAAYKTLLKSGPFSHTIIYKCLESVRHHLRKASPIVEEEKMSLVLNELREFLNVISITPSLVT